MAQGDNSTVIAGRFICGAGGSAERSVPAWDAQLGRSVVLQRLENSVDARRAARLLCLAPHRHVAVTRHDVVTEDGTRYVVVDKASDASLRHACADEIAIEDATRWIRQLREAVAHLHAAGITHGVIHEGNVELVDRGGARDAVLVGFGRDGSLRSDRVALRLMARRVLAATGAKRSARRQSAYALGLFPSRRPQVLAAAVLATMSAVLVLVPSSERLRANPTPRARPVPAQPASAGAAHAGQALVAPAALERDAAALVESVTRPASPPTAVASNRLGVYTPSAEFGQFDIYRADTGAAPVFQYHNIGLLMLWSHVATLDDGWLFFYRAADGAMGTSPVEPDGRLGYGDATLAGQAGWSEVTSAGEIVWFYRTETGTAWAIRYADGYHAGDRTHEGRVRPGYDHVVGVGPRSVLHYQSATGLSQLVHLDGNGRIEAVREFTLPKAWTAVAGTPGGRVVGVTATGEGAVVEGVDGVFRRGTTFRIGGLGWHQAVGLRDGVVFGSVTGAANIVRLDDRGAARATPWRVPAGALLVAVR